MRPSVWSPTDNGRVRWLGHAPGHRARFAVLLALALAAAGCAAVLTIRDQRDESAREQRQEALERRHAHLARRAKQPARVAPALSAEQIAAHNDAARQLNLPWPMLLETFERQANPELALTLLEPDGRKQLVQVQAEALRIPTLLNYAEALGRGPGVEKMLLLQHETNEQDANLPARLSFRLRLSPTAWSGPTERSP